MNDRNEAVRFLVNVYFGGDAAKAASAAGFSKQQVTNWVNGSNQPQTSIVKQLVHAAAAPAFRLIVEFEPINFPDGDKGLHGRINELLSGHEKASGLYAFYDSMAQLIYIGKSNGNLAFE